MDRVERAGFWNRHIEGWQSSGQSQRAYCEREAIALSSLRWWLRKRRAADRPDTIRFVPVEIGATTGTCEGSIEVVLLSGRRLRLSAPRNETALARLVRLLEVMPC